jgi:type I restriction enzyme S subunit
MARAVFREWFVDNPEVEGWDEIPFHNFVIPSKDRIGDEDAPEYSATVHGLSLRDNNFKKTLSQSKVKNKKIVKNDLVFGLSRETINFGVMLDDIGSVSPVYEIFKVNHDVYIPELLEMYIRLKMGDFLDILKSSSREGQAIDREYLLTKIIRVPDYELQKKYQETCLPLGDQIIKNNEQSRTLAELRDTLLPRLMRGEVRVRM